MPTTLPSVVVEPDPGRVDDEHDDDERRAALADLVSSRRTNLRVDPDRPVPDAVIAELARLATWAPNHKQTWPWRFASFTGGGRRRLGDAMADALESDGRADAGKIAKTRVKYLRSPVVLAVGSAPHDNPLFHAENRDAVAAGIQNLLLGATAAGLASFWGSAPPETHAAVAELAAWEPGTTVVGLVYLGWPIGVVPVPHRPEPHVTQVRD